MILLLLPEEYPILMNPNTYMKDKRLNKWSKWINPFYEGIFRAINQS